MREVVRGSRALAAVADSGGGRTPGDESGFRLPPSAVRLLEVLRHE